MLPEGANAVAALPSNPENPEDNQGRADYCADARHGFYATAVEGGRPSVTANGQDRLDPERS